MKQRMTMIKPHHVLKLNKLFRNQFVCRLQGRWFTFQDETDSRTPAIVFTEITRGHYQLQQKIQPGDTLVDIGAHVGMWCIPLAARYPEAWFIAVEPDPTNFRHLVYNVQRAGVKNILLLNIGLWSKPCAMSPVKQDPGNTGGSASLPSPMGIVPGYTWTEFRNMLGLKEIKVLKMDCEGAEHHIIQAPTDLNGIGEVLGEVHGTAGNADNMVQLFETVPLTRLQIIPRTGPEHYRCNGEPYTGRDLEAHCINCGSVLDLWNVRLCLKSPAGYTCIPE